MLALVVLELELVRPHFYLIFIFLCSVFENSADIIDKKNKITFEAYNYLSRVSCNITNYLRNDIL